MADIQTPVDQAERSLALDPTDSFIVQAPAGAGKTGLLTKRYLRLLARVESPESIVAITFTRKAAGEMRSRVIDALQRAGVDAGAEDAHQREIGELARRVLIRDRQQAWRLLTNPGRLRIQTFDSLAASLAGQMPLLSQFGASPQTVEDARQHYLEAALRTIEQLEGEGDAAAAIARLLARLDNRVAALQSLIAAMLGRRDQWLRHIVNPERRVREAIEGTLAEIVAQALEELAQAVPLEIRQELPAVARFAADNLGPDSPIAACRDLPAMPESDPAFLPVWQGLAALLLTKDGWRKTVTKTSGFPTSDKEMKGRMLGLLERLRVNDLLRDKFTALAALPAPAYEDEEWLVLEGLFAVLRRAVAELKLVFQAHGEVDFAEISLAALHALGQGHAPSELLLKLDYRIQHLLVDEFQDTSINQFLLLEKLISGWEEGDGRTLFLVGDPMQSIYRFREAEVGLFLKVMRQGIAGIRPKYLQLRVNFRSQQGIIDWANRAFPQVLPEREDMTLGAVPYARSVAQRTGLSGEAVRQHCFIGRDDPGEAERIAEIVRGARAENPQGGSQRIAILVSSRAHLAEVVRVLRERRLPFNAVDIDSLANKPVVQDLLALTRALLHLGDRISWLALLRAPYCGLTLADLYRLAGDALGAAVIDLLRRTDRVAALSEDGRCRLQRVIPILESALAERGRHPLRDWVEWSWTALGGPAAVEDATALLDAEAYFQLLETLDAGGDLDDFSQLPQQVETLFAQPDSNAGNDLQLMTIHSAKGLEFDTVILPGLGKQPSRDRPQLLYWLEQASEEQEGELLFGPIKAVGQRQDGRTASYIKGLEADKRELETGRLLYVAATRAKKRLHLLGHVSLNSRGELIRPPRNSLLHSLWPVVEDEYERCLEAGRLHIPEAADDQAGGVYLARHRLASDWSCPPPPTGVGQMKALQRLMETAPVEFNWASDMARHVGVVVHRLLEYLAGSGAVDAALDSPGRFDQIAGQMLAGEGLAAGELEQARQRVMDALRNTLSDERGRWILSARHQAAHCEMAITTCADGEFQHLVIDRTFIDEEGVRWVIDYKTSTHMGGDMEAFLDREQARYQVQLERYAAVFRISEGRPVRMALYFPLLRGWREWGNATVE